MDTFLCGAVLRTPLLMRRRLRRLSKSGQGIQQTNMLDFHYSHFYSV